MEKEKKQSGISFFEKYLTLWVALCMVAGVLIGRFLPAIPEFLGRFENAEVSIPIAILIWLMIYPLMLKVGKGRHVMSNNKPAVMGPLVEAPVIIALVNSALFLKQNYFDENGMPKKVGA